MIPFSSKNRFKFRIFELFRVIFSNFFFRNVFFLHVFYPIFLGIKHFLNIHRIWMFFNTFFKVLFAYLNIQQEMRSTPVNVLGISMSKIAFSSCVLQLVWRNFIPYDVLFRFWYQLLLFLEAEISHFLAPTMVR